ncbi:uncharacterized protein TERG_07267 [Trichophyton rubrum CBS 118892]|uniref:Uncharacterized protein n=3 Tax=Trichophyton TaxID=5550 RepID=F2SXH2_TRIRC|nr:uncharacterized protein TERG_07267 [Trichophyton rubrum CBS 118892]XP_047607197.1 uncharacterized protein TERG_07267 [Trichophyton rubrum CBS 118892]EGD91044.2 hypothetical protein TERG_07267 [Trichophyton rubrum CBS 118892]KFL62651.1 hypothetical protein TERG_07267 [Trichophyton rubrum CBS 118892]
MALPMLLFTPSSHRHDTPRISSSFFMLLAIGFSDFFATDVEKPDAVETLKYQIQRIGELKGGNGGEQWRKKGISSGENVRNVSIACDMRRQGVKRR